MNNLTLATVFILLLLPSRASSAEAPAASIEGLGGVRVTGAQMIWDAAPHRSGDGVNWDAVTQTEAGGGYVNETAFVFEPDDRCVALLRREGGNSRLGVSQPPYDRWTWSDLDERFNGPALLRLPDGRLLAGGRSKTLGAASAKTAVAWLTTEPPALRPLLWLPSQHETGYPGLVFHEGRAWASYYSSQSGKCAIYIAELELIEGQ